MWQSKGVLLGVAEVKLPIKRLSEDEQNKVLNAVRLPITNQFTKIITGYVYNLIKFS